MDELKLYYLPTCPYSLKVLRFIQENGIALEMRPTTEPENRDFLLAHGGKNQVPCLFIGDQALYESDDIIDYLKERFM
ncbi:MAG: glutathione S-transferase N-terminal domain-containing protein [Coriobacteriales bacterium]|jgi:glutathione S-transferase|nr:glutathione S-transferase N-terminal domain-containing protein [Coriobacteriales bacterium]